VESTSVIVNQFTLFDLCNRVLNSNCVRTKSLKHDVCMVYFMCCLFNSVLYFYIDLFVC